MDSSRHSVNRQKFNLGQDLFSHRLETYSVGQMQYGIFCEDLVRNNFGAVFSETFKIIKPDMDYIKDLDNIFEIMNKEFQINIFKEPTKVYLISDEWCSKFSVDFKISRLPEEEFPTTNRSKYSSIIDKIYVEVVYINKNDLDKIKTFFSNLGFLFLGDFDVEKGIPVTFAFPGPRGIEYISQSFDEISINSVENNYESEVIEKTTKFLSLAKESTHGLLLISGPVGTGKSYLIRSILTELNERRAVVCSPPTEFLFRAGMLTQVAANFGKSIIVLEDIGEIVAIDAASKYEDARANLLNFSEGLLSLLVDGIIIVSFNYSIEKIDPAILRPGRCLAHIKIDRLSYEKSKSLVPFEIPKSFYSLAEIYEMRRTEKIISIKEDRLGLRRN